MLTCNNCKRSVDNNLKSCYYCGSKELVTGVTQKELLNNIEHETTEAEVKEGHLIAENSVDGIRIIWNGPINVTIEMKGHDGEWRVVPQVTDMTIHFSAEQPYPTIRMGKIILPADNTSYIEDENDD